MRSDFNLLFVALCAALLTGCSSFQLGGFCYAPARGGQCMATSAPVTGEEGAQPAATTAPVTLPSVPAVKP